MSHHSTSFEAHATPAHVERPERCRSSSAPSTPDGALQPRLRRRARTSHATCLALATVLACAPRGTDDGTRQPRQLNASLRHLHVPTAPLERDALATIAGVRTDRVELAVALPPTIGTAQTHPILVAQVTADARSNVDALSAYAPAALEQGYVVLTAQATPWPAAGHDTVLHRYASLRAALRWLAGELPGSEHWPIVLAGFSGGAKISQVLAFSSMLERRRVLGVFLGGCNEDHSRVLLGEFPSLAEPFSHIAYYLSVGREDRIAPPDSVRDVASSLRAAGAGAVEVSVHAGEHRLDARDLSRALRWFRSRL
jgi:predicted esterase